MVVLNGCWGKNGAAEKKNIVHSANIYDNLRKQNIFIITIVEVA